jgi:hypothetical protein
MHLNRIFFWPQEWRHSTPVSPVRATVKRLFIGSAPGALLSAPVQLKIAPLVTWFCNMPFLWRAQVALLFMARLTFSLRTRSEVN